MATRMENTTKRKRVVVVGAGFGGLSIARALGDTEVDVLVIDRHNYHGFWPLLYQVATAGLEPESISYPVRAILRRYHNVQFQLGEVTGVDFDSREVLLQGQEPLSYDYLVLSAGSTNNYFGNHSIAEQAYGLKDLDEAIQLRNRILMAFEQATHETDPYKRAELLTFVIIGGGPTGVELAGAFSELIYGVLREDYPTLDVAQARIILVEANKTLLGAFPPELQRNAMKQLKKMHVEVRLGTAVSMLDGHHLYMKDETCIDAATVVWAAGVRAALLTDTLRVPLTRGSRVPITPTMNLAERPEVFIIGDMAYLEGYKKNQPYPQVAQVAIQMGEQAAANILATEQGKKLRNFKYFDKGIMATIGRRSAVMDAFGLRLTGLPAWISWLVVHLFFLIGFRNRLIVLANWAYSYFTYDRGTRLITGPTKNGMMWEEDADKPETKLEKVV